MDSGLFFDSDASLAASDQEVFAYQTVSQDNVLADVREFCFLGFLSVGVALLISLGCSVALRILKSASS